MRFHVVFAAALFTLIGFAADAQQREGGRGDDIREACREEARRVIKPGRTGRLDRDQLIELRREYQRDCRAKAKAR